MSILPRLTIGCTQNPKIPKVIVELFWDGKFLASGLFEGATHEESMKLFEDFRCYIYKLQEEK